MKRPVVSVLMTAYNRENFISEAIESVLASTYPKFELIIVDDCSTDRTAEIAKSYRSKDSRVVVYINEKNLGDYPNRNRARSYAKGDYIMFVDSDDTIYPEGIEHVIQTMQKFPEASFGMRLFNRDCEPFQAPGREVIRGHFFQKSSLTIGPGGTVLKRSFLEEINGYPEKYGPANDMYFNLKAANQCSMVLIPFEYMNYRLHDGQQQNNRFSYLYNNYLFLNDALKELDLPLNEKEKRWLMRKNKRRFFVNLFKYYRAGYSLPQLKVAIDRAGFTIKDSLQAVFQI